MRLELLSVATPVAMYEPDSTSAGVAKMAEPRARDPSPTVEPEGYCGDAITYARRLS
jgi:hypothetical protein